MKFKTKMFCTNKQTDTVCHIAQSKHLSFGMASAATTLFHPSIFHFKCSLKSEKRILRRSHSRFPSSSPSHSCNGEENSIIRIQVYKNFGAIFSFFSFCSIVISLSFERNVDRRLSLIIYISSTDTVNAGQATAGGRQTR